MSWGSFFFALSVVIAIVSLPFYRIETIKYKQILEDCREDWSRAQELSELYICKNPVMRDRYRDYIKCDQTKRSLIISPEDRAFGVWWDQFFLVRAAIFLQEIFTDSYQALVGTWYIYLLCMVLSVVFVWSWVSSGAKLQDRREERAHQSNLLRQWSDQFGGFSRKWTPPPPGQREYILQDRYDRRHAVQGQLEYQ